MNVKRKTQILIKNYAIADFAYYLYANVIFAYDLTCKKCKKYFA